MTNSRNGWRKFSCECGKGWEWPTRDVYSPSGENCPDCGDFVHPCGGYIDENLHADEFGNLLVPWNSEKIRNEISEKGEKKITHFFPDGTSETHQFGNTCMCEINWILKQTRGK